jgi:hypothetical protein
MPSELFSDNPEKLKAHEKMVDDFLGRPDEQEPEASEDQEVVSLGRKVEQISSTIAEKNNHRIDLEQLAPLENLFVKLPKESQDQIISDIENSRKAGVDPRQLIVRAFQLVKIHKDFSGLGFADQKDDESDKNAEKALEEILTSLKEVRDKGKVPDQMDLPFEEGKNKDDETNKGWVN